MRAPNPAFPRAPEEVAAALTARGVRASAVRLAPSVHGGGDHGFIPRLIAIAREKGVSLKEIAGVIGRRLNLPVVSKHPDEANEHFGWFAMFTGMDVPASSQRTQALLGWQPTGPDLLVDIDQPGYYAHS